MANKIALITGITGQDGTYLTKFLLSKGYDVHGIKRRTSAQNNQRMDRINDAIDYTHPQLFLHFGDLADTGVIMKLIQHIKPDEVYHLAAMSHVHASFEQPEYTSDVNGLGALRILEAIKMSGMEQEVRFYQASTSELFGNSTESPQSEKTPFLPTSPYAVSKLFAYWMTANYRNTYGLYACNGILFNHESPLRGESFVSRKITLSVAKIALGLQETLFLGNLNARRDWGHAEDYVEAMWLILQQQKADDYVIATGISTSVREFVKKSFGILGVFLYFEGEGIEEKGYCQFSENSHFKIRKHQLLLAVDPQYYRPTDVECLTGDARKANQRLAWYPKKSIDILIGEMVAADLQLIKYQQLRKF
jgi:GDPmannose 4,6-dehydratase